MLKHGHCMKDAYMALLRGTANGLPATWSNLEVLLVHGTVDVIDVETQRKKRGDHAWLEVQVGEWRVVWDPQAQRTFSWEEYQRMIRAVANQKYTKAQAAFHYAEAHHTGPWH